MQVPIRPSSASWLAAALADLEVLLVDHAHCERKAAQTAIRLMARYPAWGTLQAALGRLAREELVHHERVRSELRRRGFVLRSLPSAGYAAALLALLRPSTPAPTGAPEGTHGARSVDEFLVCALIEARSHERFVRLAAAAAATEPRLAEFYARLAEAEERHGGLYVELALAAAGGDALAVTARLDELALCEAQVLARPGQPLRMHAG